MTPQLEDRLAVALQRRAEDIMETVNTEERLVDLLAAGPDNEPRRGLTGLVAVAAAAAVAAVAWLAAPGSEREDVAPAGNGGDARTAEAFLDAYGSTDRAALRTLLGEEFTWNGRYGAERLLRDVRALGATGFHVVDSSCRTGDPSEVGTYVICTFSYHDVRSELVGEGPFPGGVLDITVRDGEVVAALLDLPFDSNGYAEGVWEPFTAWVQAEHPKAWRGMTNDHGRTMDDSPRALELWERYSLLWAESRR